MNFYFDSANILDQLDAKQGSIKSVLGSLPEQSRKRTSALVIETLKYKTVLCDVIHSSKILEHEKQKISSLNLALVLIHDLLLARGIQAGDGPVKQAILRHKTRLHAEFQKAKVKRGVKDVADLARSDDPRAKLIPRYARVNRNQWATEDAVRYFLSTGLEQRGDPLDSQRSVIMDAHIADLLLFHPLARLHDDASYKAGKIILQDKASCFPAVILAPPIADDAVVIDATAAPGNKTSHLSALMCNKGKIYAFEKDTKRYSTLRKMLSSAHCANVEPIHADFLTVDPLDPRFARATHILLDPSCSGSGIVNRMDYLLETEEENEDVQSDRLNKLAAFQLMVIKHAMKFPAVRRIVYSTCSIHSKENEEVVAQILSSSEPSTRSFTLAPHEEVLPTWPRRGLQDKLGTIGDANSLIRCQPGEDHTNGFFVACFIKRPSLLGDDVQRRPEETEVQPTSSKRPGDTQLQKEAIKRKRKKRKKSVLDHPDGI